MSSSYPGFSICTTLRLQYLLLILHIRRIKLTTLNDFATRLRVPHCSFKIKGSDVNWGLADVLRLAIACNSLYYWTSSSTLQGYEAQIFSPQSRLWFYCSGPLHPIIWLVHTEPLVDLHCMSFCTACRFALHVDLHCMSFCTACRFALHVDLQCMSICTACRFESTQTQVRLVKSDEIPLCRSAECVSLELHTEMRTAIHPDISHTLVESLFLVRSGNT